MAVSSAFMNGSCAHRGPIKLKHLRSRISPKLVLYIVVFSSCITLLLTIIQLRLDYNHGVETIHQRLEQIRLTNLSVIRQSLWTYDNDSIRTQLEGMLRIPDVIAIQLNDAEDTILFALGDLQTEHVISEQFTVYREFRGENIKLGELTVTATKNNLYQKLVDTTLVILVSQGVKTFFVSAFTLALFYFMVTRHIVHIAEHQEAIDLDHQPNPLKLKRRSKNHRPDELDMLVDGYNIMTDNYYRSFNIVAAQRDRLAQNEARSKAIFNSITDSIIVTDTGRNIILVNEEFHRQFGYSSEEVVGNTTRMLYADPAEYEQQGMLRYQAGAATNTDTYEVSYIRKNGSIFPSETLGGQIRLPDGTLIGYIGIIRDISYRKQAEEDYRMLLRELQQAQKMESIGHLTGGIAHDFNNILASVLGYTDLALNIVTAEGHEKLHQYLNNIRISSERASNLVSQMLAFSRNTPSEPEAVQALQVILETIDILAPTLPSSIRIDTYLDDELPDIMVDKTQLQQVLINICVNAKDAMNAEGVLSVSLSLRTDLTLNCNSCHSSIQGDFIDIAISDTGTGIDSKTLTHIFDPFFTTKEVGKGTGMGLSVVHGIMHQHGAHINVISHQDLGTTFHLLFPPAEVPSETVEDENRSHAEAHSGHGQHLLVVDDEILILDYLRTLLEKHNYRVTACNDSRQALEMLTAENAAFDLLITDQTMPHITGLNLIRVLRDMGKAIPVILCTGYSEKVDASNIGQLGVDAYIEKPINQQDLFYQLQRLLQLPRSQLSST